MKPTPGMLQRLESWLILAETDLRTQDESDHWAAHFARRRVESLRRFIVTRDVPLDVFEAGFYRL